MTPLAIRVPLVHRKANIVILEFPVPTDVQFPSGIFGLGPVPRGEEGISAFGTEEMLFVISAFAERWVVEGDETFIDDGGFAMIAPWGEFLVIIKMTIRPPFVFIRTYMLK